MTVTTSTLRGRADAATTSHPSVTALRRVGLLGPTERPSTTPRDLSRAHSVWGVNLPDARRVIVKSGVLSSPGALHTGTPTASLGAELFVYRMANWCEPLRAALPGAIVVDEEAALLVMDDVAGSGETSLDQLWTGTTGAHPVFASLGSRLGAIHRATARLPLPPASPPLILSVLRTPRETDDAAINALMPRIAAVPALSAAAAEVSRAGGLCLVHHDLKWDNIVVPATSPATAVILDWELAGAGDPAWDLGCLVAEHLLRAPGALAPLDAAASAMLAAYARAARPSARAVEVFGRRVVLAAVLRIAQLALEVASRAAPGDDMRARDLVALSDAHAQGVPGRSEEVARCLTH